MDQRRTHPDRDRRRTADRPASTRPHLRNPRTIWVVRHGDDLNDQIDAAYRTKYRRYAASVIDAIVSPQARATLPVVPTGL
jgi:Uncharacterized protein conserved in bacteria (DUF2255)